MEQMNPVSVVAVIFMLIAGLAMIWGVLKAIRCEMLNIELKNNHSRSVRYIHRLIKHIDPKELTNMIEKGELYGLYEYVDMYDQEQKKG